MKMAIASYEQVAFRGLQISLDFCAVTDAAATILVYETIRVSVVVWVFVPAVPVTVSV